MRWIFEIVFVRDFSLSSFLSIVYFQVEPSTKLYPAVFVEPTVKEVLHFELGRIKVKLI